MRLLCPFCQKAITVPDSEAGKAVNCPECNQQFAAPQLYTPAPSFEPPAPTPPVPETYLGTTPPDRTTQLEPPDLPRLPPVDRELSGYDRMVSVPLEPKVIRCIPPVALFLAFILTFFAWNGLYPAGYAAYTQNAWQGVLGWVSRDAVADYEMKIGDDLENRVRTSWWLVPYVLFLFPTLVLAVVGPVVDLAKIKVPESIQRVWQFRPLALGILTIVTLLFLLAQWASGFGLQNAVYTKIEDDFAERKAQVKTPEQRQVWEMNVAAVKGAYNVRLTPWVRLSMLLHVLAALAVVAEAGLMLRGNKPPPRLGVMW
jgi:hypothetical protein